MPSTAALVAGWSQRDMYGRWRPAATLGGSPPPQGPSDPIGLTVELYLGPLGWTDISPFVLYRDSSVLVQIGRGRPNETSAIQPQTASLQINNKDGRFSPRNPTGPYYQQFGRNTQIRISRMQNGIRRYRFCGEVVEWPTDADISGNDVWINVTVAGQLRRLNQGSKPVGSSMSRGFKYLPAATAAVAYWPCEDAAGASVIASALPTGNVMTFTGTPTLASDTAFPGSDPLPVMNGAVFNATVSAYPASPVNSLKLAVHFPSTPDPDGTVIARMTTAGTVARAELSYVAAGSGGLRLIGYDGFGSSLFNISGSFALDGTAVIVEILLANSGTSLACSFFEFTPGSFGFGSNTTTLSSSSVGAVTAVTINPGGALVRTAVGHVVVQPADDLLLTVSNAAGGQFREPVYSVDAANYVYTFQPQFGRFGRLCYEQGVTGVENHGVNGYTGNVVTMGYQKSDTFPNLIQQAADSDLGLLYEARDQLALVLRSRVSLYNQSAGLTLDYVQHQLSAQPVPQDDDAYTRNDVTVTRIGASSVRQTLTSGTLSTAAPPAGVGTYDDAHGYSLGADAQLADQAGWRLHMGTVDEPRYPSVSINLRHPTFTGNLTMMNAAMMLDIGDVIVINNPPPQLGPDPIRLIIQGHQETMGVWEHELTFVCSPESPYRIGILDDPVLGHADTDGSTLAAAIGPILNANPFFAGGSTATWVGFKCSIAPLGTSGSANPLPAGGPTGYGVLITPDGSGLVCAAEQSASGNFPVVANQPYYTSALVYSPLGYGQVNVGVDWLDVNGAYISTSTSSLGVAAGVWTGVAQSASAPNGAFSAYVRIGLGNTPAVTDLLYATSVVAWQGAVSVATTGPQPASPLWTTTFSDFPFDIAVAGERMTVTNITGSSSPQSFTVARAINGVSKSQVAGTDVRLWQPMILSL